MKTIAFFASLLTASAAFCQTVAEPDTIKSLLVEVHQLRQDIEAMTVASQRVQIALYSLQLQDDAMSRSSQKLDAIREKCATAEANRQHTAVDLQRFESMAVSPTVSDPEARQFKAHVTDLKTVLESQTTEAQACQAREAEAATQFRNDQARFTELQDRIQRLDRALEQFVLPQK